MDIVPRDCYNNLVALGQVNERKDSIRNRLNYHREIVITISRQYLSNIYKGKHISFRNNNKIRHHAYKILVALRMQSFRSKSGYCSCTTIPGMRANFKK